MKLLVISDPAVLNDEARIVNQLFDAGLQLFHVRKPTCTKEYCRQLIAGIDKRHRNKLVLNYFHELAAEFGISRLHYPEIQRKLLTDYIADGMTLSTSIHHLQDFNTLAQFEYAFFGPVFNSISKPGYHSVLPAGFKLPDALSSLKATTDLKPGTHQPTQLIALGGITAENIRQVIEMGFDGAALLGTIWNDPLKAVQIFKKIQEKW